MEAANTEITLNKAVSSSDVNRISSETTNSTKKHEQLRIYVKNNFFFILSLKIGRKDQGEQLETSIQESDFTDNRRNHNNNLDTYYFGSIYPILLPARLK